MYIGNCNHHLQQRILLNVMCNSVQLGSAITVAQSRSQLAAAGLVTARCAHTDLIGT
jgi:hypothetical protein